MKRFLKSELLEEIAEVGHCGVYELVWTLRGCESTLTDTERIELAKEVAQEMLDSQEVVLRKYQWPSYQPTSPPITFSDIAEDEWINIPPSGSYPAFTSAN